MSAFKHFDGMAWPVPGDRLGELEWNLRYGTPTRADLLLAASVISAYSELVRAPQKHRNYVVKNLKTLAPPGAAT